MSIILENNVNNLVMHPHINVMSRYYVYILSIESVKQRVIEMGNVQLYISKMFP